MSTANDVISLEFQQKIRTEARHDRLIQIAPVIILVAFLIFFSIAAPGFFGGRNGLTLITQLAVPLILASAMTFVVLVGSIDLSIDGVMGFCGSIVGLIVLNNKNGLDLGFWSIPIVMAVGALIGLITGLIHVKGKIPSFMVTYGMLSVTAGLAIVSYDAIPPMIGSPLIRAFSLKQIAGLPLYVYVSLVIFLVAVLIQQKTAFGKYMFAIGENEELAKMSGIRVAKVKILVFVWSGVVVSVAGIIGAAQIGRGDVIIGKGMSFAALAAVVLGGTSLSGGRGGIINTLIGTVIITVLNNGLVLMSVNPYMKDAIMGIILIVAVIMSIKRGAKLVTK